MKIQCNSIYNYNKQNQKQQYKTNPMRNDCVILSSKKNISFSSDTTAELNIKIQAKALKLQAESFHREACEIRRDTELLQIRASKIQKEAQNIKRSSKKIYDDVMSIYSEAEKSNFQNQREPHTGEITREFYDGDDGQFIMEEYENNKTVRKVIFDDRVIMVMLQNPRTKKDDSYIFDGKTGELIQFARNINVLADGYKADDEFFFDENVLITYDKGHRTIDGVSEKSAEHYSFKNGRLKEYNADFVRKKNGSNKSAEYFIYRNGIIQKAYMNYEDKENLYKKAGEEYNYGKDGVVGTCALNINEEYPQRHSLYGKNIYI